MANWRFTYLFLFLWTPFFLFSCNKTSNPRSGKTIYGSFAVGALGGILRAVSPANPGSTDIIQNPMPSDPVALELWLEEPSGKCPQVNADFNPIPPGTDPLVLWEPAQCRTVNVDTGTTAMNTAGSVLWRLFDLCQYDGMTASSWIKSEMLVKFQNQADCTDFQDQSLLGPGKKVTLTYGNGQNGDQQNRFFSSNGEVQYVYTDFPSGFNELKSGGAEITFGGDSKPSQISIKGFEVKNFQQVETDLNERKLFKKIDIELNPENFKNHLELIDHVTLSTTSTLQVSYAGNIAAVNSGQILTQDNESGSLLLTQVGSPLVFSDPNCCWPTSGTLVTSATENRNFSEVLTFTATCGKADLNRPFRKGVANRETYTLPYCF